MEKNKHKQDNAKRKRSHQIIIRCSTDELREINQAIKKSEMSRVDFILAILQNDNIVIVDDLKEICIELKKQGINLNQSLRFAHQYGDERELIQAVQQCGKLYDQAKTLLFATDNKIKTLKEVK